MSYSTQCKIARAKNKWRLRELLDNFGMTQRDLANEVGVHEQIVWNTFNGVGNSYKVLDWLWSKNVPASLICDPRRKPDKAA